MNEAMILAIGRQALVTTLVLAGPMLGLGLVVGVLVSLFQATTQLNDQTLAFIPKILVVMVSVLVFGPWMLRTMLDFTDRIFALVPAVVR